MIVLNNLNCYEASEFKDKDIWSLRFADTAENLVYVYIKSFKVVVGQVVLKFLLCKAGAFVIYLNSKQKY